MPKVDIWSRLTPESQAVVEKSRALAAEFKSSSSDPLVVAREAYLHERRYWNSFKVDLPVVQDFAMDGAHGTVPLRLYRPVADGVLPVLLYAHGGGFILGNLDSHDRICRLLAQRSGWAVVAVDYTLAPDKKFPVQPEQVYAALCHVHAQADALQLRADRIAVGGDSAGAALVLAATLQARGAGWRPSVCAQLLYYGGFGLKDGASRRLYGWADLDGLGDKDTSTFVDHYVARREDRDNPLSNLLANDMAGMPPTYIGAVAYDPLRDDSLALAEYLKEAKVPHQLAVYEGVLHAFLHYSAVEPRAVQALEDGAAFLRRLSA